MAGTTAKKAPRPRWGEASDTPTEVSWADASADSIHRAIAVADKAGVALLFGRTRDGGAISVRVFEPDRAYTRYLPPRSDIDEELGSLAEYLIAAFPDRF